MSVTAHTWGGPKGDRRARRPPRACASRRSSSAARRNAPAEPGSRTCPRSSASARRRRDLAGDLPGRDRRLAPSSPTRSGPGSPRPSPAHVLRRPDRRAAATSSASASRASRPSRSCSRSTSRGSRCTPGPRARRSRSSRRRCSRRWAPTPTTRCGSASGGRPPTPTSSGCSRCSPESSSDCEGYEPHDPSATTQPRRPLRTRCRQVRRLLPGGASGSRSSTSCPARCSCAAAGTTNHHDLGLFSVGPDAPLPAPSRVGLYHLAWEVPSIHDITVARDLLTRVGAYTGESDHGVSKSVYGHDPDGNEFEIMWAVPAASSGASTQSVPWYNLWTSPPRPRDTDDPGLEPTSPPACRPRWRSPPRRSRSPSPTSRS